MGCINSPRLYLEEMDTSSLKSLTHKVVMLLTLSTATLSTLRAQTSSKIKISNIKTVTDGLEIRILEFLKCSGVGKNQTILQYYRYLPIRNNNYALYPRYYCILRKLKILETKLTNSS